MIEAAQATGMYVLPYVPAREHENVQLPIFVVNTFVIAKNVTNIPVVHYNMPYLLK